MFRRADVVWLVFDSAKPIDLEPIRREAGSVIGDVSAVPLEQGQAIRMRLNRPQLASLIGDEKAGQNWVVTFADAMQTPSQPLTAIRNITDPARANVTVPIAKPGLMHRLVDPDAGDALMVITAPPPGRGFVRRQDFVEFSLLKSIHGVVIQPNSDDVTAEIASDKITLSRPGGLTLSSADVGAERAATAVRPVFDVNEWRKNQSEDFIKRLDVLVTASASASAEQRTPARLDLARFYMSRGHVSGSQGRARSCARRGEAGAGRSFRADRAFGRLDADGPPGTGPEGSGRRRRSGPITIPSSGRRWPWRGRANGPTRAKNSRTSNSPSPRCRSNCSAR